MLEIINKLVWSNFLLILLLGTGLMSDKKSLKKKVKKTANKAIDAMDGILSSVQGMVK